MTYLPAPLRRAPRRGYTLLEVSVALAISVVLLGALYVAMSLQAHQTRTGRQIIEQSAVARALLTRISNDMSTHLPPVDPRVVGSKNMQNASAGGTSASSSSTTGSTTSGSTTSGGTSSGTSASGQSGSAAKGSGSSSSGSNSSGSGSSSSGSGSGSSGSGSSSSSSGQSGGLGMAFFNLGVQGDDTHLSLYVAQVPSSKEAPLNGDAMAQPVSDLRRVSYWLVAGDPGGLAREELKVATSADALALAVPADGDEAAHVFAKEVTGLSFEYFDGSAWQTSWDGTQLKSDGVTPIGPPVAIAVTLTLSSEGDTKNSPRRQTSVRHVVFLPASNGLDLPDSTGNQSSSGGTSP